jgi:hypothetical protein
MYEKDDQTDVSIPFVGAKIPQIEEFEVEVDSILPVSFTLFVIFTVFWHVRCR